MASRKIVICGAGFLGSYVARELARSSRNAIHLASLNPEALHNKLISESATSQTTYPPFKLCSPYSIDITKPETLTEAFDTAHTIVSLVGILHGSPAQFEQIQWKGAENVAIAAKSAGARFIHISAIGANTQSSIPYFRTKGLAEEAIFEHIPQATVIRPALIFGPGDGFFARFATLSKYLPFMPVFGGGRTLFQPVYAGDIARLVEMCTRDDPELQAGMSGKIIEAGGPDGRWSFDLGLDPRGWNLTLITRCPTVFTYRQMMEIVLKYTNRTRPIMSLPFAAGYMQGLISEQFPTNILTITRDQVEQLKYNNIVSSVRTGRLSGPSFSDWLVKHDSRTLGPSSVHVILPSYL